MGLLFKLYVLFLKLGFVSFGGGYALMGMIYEESNRAVGLTSIEFADMAALELLASGPIAINAATYVGYIKGGFAGALAATLGVCTPCFVLVGLLQLFLNKFHENKMVQGFLQGIKIACGGLLLNTALVLGKSIFVAENHKIVISSFFWVRLEAMGIGVFCIVLMLRFKVDPIKVIGIAALLGAIFL